MSLANQSNKKIKNIKEVLARLDKIDPNAFMSEEELNQRKKKYFQKDRNLLNNLRCENEKLSTNSLRQIHKQNYKSTFNFQFMKDTNYYKNSHNKYEKQNETKIVEQKIEPQKISSKKNIGSLIIGQNKIPSKFNSNQSINNGGFKLIPVAISEDNKQKDQIQIQPQLESKQLSEKQSNQIIVEPAQTKASQWKQEKKDQTFPHKSEETIQIQQPKKIFTLFSSVKQNPTKNIPSIFSNNLTSNIFAQAPKIPETSIIRNIFSAQIIQTKQPILVEPVKFLTQGPTIFERMNGDKLNLAPAKQINSINSIIKKPQQKVIEGNKNNSQNQFNNNISLFNNNVNNNSIFSINNTNNQQQSSKSPTPQLTQNKPFLNSLGNSFGNVNSSKDNHKSNIVPIFASSQPLVSQVKPSQTKISLFGAPNSQNSLKSQSQKSSVNIFGSNQIFNNENANKPLFNNNNTNPGLSLFGNPNTTPSPNLFSNNNTGNLFNNKAMREQAKNKDLNIKKQIKQPVASLFKQQAPSKQKQTNIITPIFSSKNQEKKQTQKPKQISIFNISAANIPETKPQASKSLNIFSQGASNNNDKGNIFKAPNQNNIFSAPTGNSSNLFFNNSNSNLFKSSGDLFGNKGSSATPTLATNFFSQGASSKTGQQKFSLFNNQNNIFNNKSTPGNNSQEGEDQEEDDGPIEAEETANPSLSTGTYQYIKTQVLFKEPVVKFRQGIKQTLQGTNASLQKFPNDQNLYLYVRMANKTLALNGKIVENITETRILNDNAKNIEIKKVLILPKNGQKANKTELGLLKFQFKQTLVGQKFKKIIDQQINKKKS